MSEHYHSPTDKVGNEDRDAAVEHLAERVASGHLTQDEFTERRDKALSARTWSELSVLTKDIPPLPEPVPEKYKTQALGYDYPFSPWRWIGSITLGLSMIVIPGPIMSAHWGGFDHIPMHGLGAVLTIFGGAIVLLVCGLGFLPDGEAEKPRPGSPGGRRW